MIQVVLIDDHELVRSGLKEMLEKDASIRVIGEADNGVEGIRLVRSLKPDVVILDVNLPDISGLEVTRRLLSSSQSVKILVVSAVTDDLFPFKLLDEGASSYLTKNASRTEFFKAVKDTYAGKRVITPAVAQRFFFSKIGTKKGSFSDLSPRETEVMRMVIHNVRTKEIAEKLHVKPHTVYSYRSRIFQKLRVKNAMDLQLLAIRQGVVGLHEADPSASRHRKHKG